MFPTQHIEFLNLDGINAFWVGLIIGTQVMMLIYTCFLYASSRNRAQYFHLLSVICSGLLIIELITSANALHSFNLTGAPLALLAISCALNHISLCKLISPNCRIVNFNKPAQYILLVLFAASLMSLYTAGPWTILGLTTACVIVGFDISLAARHFYSIQGSNYIMAAFSCFLACCVLLLLGQSGAANGQLLTSSLPSVLLITMMVTQSLAFMDGINQERNAKEMAQTALLEVQRKINSTLEDTVAIRTLELETANEQLKIITEVDSLTGVKNRRYFDLRSEQIYSLANRSKTTLSLIMIDLDNFKQINDRYGHQIGDLCLQSAATIMRMIVTRDTDIVTRYGGEEFAVLLPNTDEDGAQAIAEKIRQGIEQTPIESEQGKIRLSASLGVVSEVPSNNNQLLQFINKADQALYMAKHNGRNQTRCWREEFTATLYPERHHGSQPGQTT